MSKNVVKLISLQTSGKNEHKLAETSIKHVECVCVARNFEFNSGPIDKSRKCIPGAMKKHDFNIGFIDKCRNHEKIDDQIAADV